MILNRQVPASFGEVIAIKSRGAVGRVRGGSSGGDASGKALRRRATGTACVPIKIVPAMYEREWELKLREVAHGHWTFFEAVCCRAIDFEASGDWRDVLGKKTEVTA